MTKLKNSQNIDIVKSRHSGIELLRIIAMLMIIGHHLALFGLTDYGQGFNHFVANIFHFGGKLGVDIFVIISAYFLTNKNFNVKHLLNLIFQVLFYSLLFFIIFSCINDNFSIKVLISSVFPIIFNNYWFATTYVLLYLTFPLLNIIVKNINQNQHKLIILLILFLCMILPQVLGLNYFYNDIIWFIALYFVSSYIKLYGIKFSTTEWCILLCFWIMGLIATIIGQASSFSQNSFLVFPVSILLFLIFKNINFSSKIINTIASTTFGVYLIHENEFIRAWLWDNIKTLYIQTSPYFILYGIMIIISVFIICMLIEFFYKFTFGKIIKKQIEKVVKHFNKLKLNN